jgi:hypothetical protein
MSNVHTINPHNTNPTPDSSGSRFRDGAKAVLWGGAIGATVVAAGAVGKHLYEADQAKKHHEDAVMERVMEPTAQKVAQFAINHATEKPFLYNGKYQYTVGKLKDGNTTLDVEVRKVPGKAPSASDVTQIDFTTWAAPGGSFGKVGPQSGEMLTLHGSRWVAVGNFDQKPPYDNSLDFDSSYDSADKPYTSFQENVDTARRTVQLVNEDRGVLKNQLR